MTLKTLFLFLAFSSSVSAAVFQYGGIKHDITSQNSTLSTIILSNASTQVQRVTGSANQVLKLPDATTLRSGYWYTAINESSGTLTVSNSASTGLKTLAAGSAASPTSATFYVTSNSLAAGPWSIDQGAASGGGGTNPGQYNYIGYYSAAVDTDFFYINSASYIDFLASGTALTLTQQTNNNFGSVTKNSTFPSVSFTAPKTGTIYVCFKGVFTAGVGGAVSHIKIVDGSAVDISAPLTFVGATSVSFSQEVCAFTDTTSGNSYVYKLRGKTGSGNLYMSNFPGTVITIQMFYIN